MTNLIDADVIKQEQKEVRANLCTESDIELATRIAEVAATEGVDVVEKDLNDLYYYLMSIVNHGHKAVKYPHGLCNNVFEFLENRASSDLAIALSRSVVIYSQSWPFYSNNPTYPVPAITEELHPNYREVRPNLIKNGVDIAAHDAHVYYIQHSPAFASTDGMNSVFVRPKTTVDLMPQYHKNLWMGKYGTLRISLTEHVAIHLADDVERILDTIKHEQSAKG